MGVLLSSAPTALAVTPLRLPGSFVREQSGRFGHKERRHVCRLVDGGQTVLGDRH